MSALPPYCSYKRSGVEWMGNIPAHWRAVRLKNCIRRIEQGWSPDCENRLAEPDEWGVLKVGCVNYGVFRPEEHKALPPNLTERPELEVRAGQLLMSRANTTDLVGHVAIVPQGTKRLMLCDKLYRLEPRSETVHSHYLAYALRSESTRVRIMSEATGASSSMQNIGQDTVKNCVFPLPPLDEQEEIIAFLDRETARIDGLIAKKRRLIELLREKRQAVISHAVTKGLDPTAPTKHSGIECFGEIPAHWEFMRMKHCIKRIEQGWSPDCENRPAEPGEWAVLKVGCVNNGVFRPDEHKALPSDLDPRPALEVRAGQLLMSRANTIDLVGQVAIVPPGTSRLMLCDKLYRIEMERRKVSTRFLAYVLRSDGSRLQLMSEATGASSSMQNIGQDTVKNCLVGFPPIEEQNMIIQYLDQHESEIERAEQIAERAIVKLEEHRAALIAAAVTGKIDVRTHSTDTVEAAD